MRISIKTLSYLILGASIVLAIITRFYKLGEVPKGFYVDEAGYGYSAYSILKTGKDEFGKALPIIFRSFTDYKTSVYAYLIVPLIPIFGLTAFAVRFPSFFFGALTIPLLFLLVREISPKKQSLVLASLASLLLAISPWHILFGRTTLESNVALFFFLGGIYLFYRGLKKPYLLILSAISFAIAIPAYQAQRIITPLTVLILLIRYKKTLLSKPYIKPLLIGAIVALLISIPTLSVASTPGFWARATGLNIFFSNRFSPLEYMPGLTGLLGSFLNSPFFLSTREFLSLYFAYLFPRNMFILGDYDPRVSFPELATFFVWQAPFYLLGLYVLIKDKKLGDLRFLTLVLLLIGPLPAATTRDPYSSIRALHLVIPQIVAVSLGITYFFGYLKKRIYRLAAVGLFILVVVYSIAKLYSSVIILNEYYRAQDLDYGWEEVAATLKTLDPKLGVVVDDARENPYIHLLFFLRFDPITYQKENFEVPLSEYYTNMYVQKVKKIGNITVRGIDWKPDLKIKQYLVGDSLAISTQQIEVHGLTLIKEVYYPDGSPAFRIVQTNP